MKTTRTASPDRFEVARTLNDKQSWMYWELGSIIRNRFLSDHGFTPNEDYCQEKAFIYLESTGWKSVKTAKAMLTVARGW